MQNLHSLKRRHRLGAALSEHSEDGGVRTTKFKQGWAGTAQGSEFPWVAHSGTKCGFSGTENRDQPRKCEQSHCTTCLLYYETVNVTIPEKSFAKTHPRELTTKNLEAHSNSEEHRRAHAFNHDFEKRETAGPLNFLEEYVSLDFKQKATCVHAALLICRRMLSIANYPHLLESFEISGAPVPKTNVKGEEVDALCSQGVGRQVDAGTITSFYVFR